MKEEISFLHAADLHLDSPFAGLRQVPEHVFHDIQKSTFAALTNLVQSAIEKEVDFVLLTGDLFDNEKQSLKAQIHLRNAFQELNRSGINVYLSYGNHDYTKGNIHPITYPDNVFVFPDENISHFIFERNDHAHAAIYGFSYENRAIRTNKALEFEAVDTNIPYHIAMLHGSTSSNTEHDVYAPFRVTDLTGKYFDYWALGHIHKREILHTDPYIVYPGNTQGRNHKEAGEKGCYHVKLSSAKTTVTFVGLEAVQFQNITADVSDCSELHQLESKLQQVIDASVTEKGRGKPILIHLQLTSNHTNLGLWNTEKYLDEIIDLVNASLVHQKNWHYIYRYNVKSRNNFMEKDLFYGEHFAGELMRHFKEASIQPFLTDLFKHRKARKYLEPFSEKEEQMIKDEAKQLLMQELLQNKGE